MPTTQFDMPARPASFEARGGWVVVRLMADLDLVMNAAGGLVGNCGFESGGFDHLQEISPIAGAGGYGWPQWTGPRRHAYEAWCEAAGLDPASDQANYGYLVEELRSTQKHTLDELRALGADVSLEDAVWSVGQTFERPAGTTDDNLPGYDGRLHWGQRAIAGAKALQAGGTPVPPPAPATAGPDPIVEKQKEVQQALAGLGYYKGPIDGDPGTLTRAAMAAYRTSCAV